MGNYGKILPGFDRYCRKAAAEGAVLLKNERQTLPIKKDECVSVFGRCQMETYRSGTGSGGAVNVPYKISILEGMRQSGAFTINEEICEIYEKWLAEHPFDNGGGGWAQEPWNQQEMVITEEMSKKAAQKSQKAIYVIGRTAGEDKDYEEVRGSYLLTEEELENLRVLTKYFDKVAVLMNVSNIIDMSWVEDPVYQGHLTSVMYIWQGGMEAGNAAAELLSGKETPSGKLTDTIAAPLQAYPASKNFGDRFCNLYEEDIYVGYRYFETFCPEKVLYEFGYGLSYTSFMITIEEAKSIADEYIRIVVSVRNLGEYQGKEVVQVYVEAPQGMLGKPSRELKAFAKTKELLPEETQRLTFEIPLYEIASYDDSGKTGHKSCYVLEKGSYNFYVGNSVRADKRADIDGKGSYCVAETTVTESLNEAMAPEKRFERLIPQSTEGKSTYEIGKEIVPQKSVNMNSRIMENLPKAWEMTGDLGIRLQDAAKGERTLQELVAQFTKEELAEIVRGEEMSSPRVTPGTAAAFGGVSKALCHYGIPAACCADGPSGIRMEDGLNATQLPIGTLLACSFNVPLIEELYEMEGRELVSNEIDTLLGPGMNIHRHPLNGRNFEYFSEDPYVTGCIGAAMVRGMKKGGAEGTIKHFAANNQETGRNTADAVVSERALREIYLKGFELAVKKGKAASIMTSYNPINGHWSASNYDLNTTILRKEWGFHGIVMTDWWAQMNHPVKGGKESRKLTSAMVRSQNDLYMVVNNYGAEVNSMEDDTLEALEKGELTIGELQRSAENICRFLLNAPVMKREIKPPKAPEKYEALKTAENEKVLIEPEDDILRWKPEIGSTNEIFIKKHGIYRITARIGSHQMELAQLSTNLMINGKKVLTIQAGGTIENFVTQKIAEAELEAGYYEIFLKEIKAGLEFEWLEFRLQ